MFDERPSHDPSPSTSTTTSARRANSTTTSSNPETSGPSTVPAGAEAAYSLGNPISTIFNQIFGSTNIKILFFKQNKSDFHNQKILKQINKRKTYLYTMQNCAMFAKRQTLIDISSCCDENPNQFPTTRQKCII